MKGGGRAVEGRCLTLVTEPKTTCLPSSQSVLTVQRKNCEPLVPGPALAIDRMPAVKRRWKASERQWQVSEKQ